MSGGLYSTEGRDFDQTLDLKKIKPYGDTMNDGKTQLSFTLPVPAGDEAIEAAKQLMKKMGFENPQVVFHREPDGRLHVLQLLRKSHPYGRLFEYPCPESRIDQMGHGRNGHFIREQIGRPIVVIGASTGTDAHTVGIDAIMNMKGFAGHYGLERYEMFEALNMGSQVTNEEFIAKAIELKADALLVSQTVTQKDIHIKNLTEPGRNARSRRAARQSDSGVRRPAHLARTGQRVWL